MLIGRTTFMPGIKNFLSKKAYDACTIRVKKKNRERDAQWATCSTFKEIRIMGVEEKRVPLFIYRVFSVTVTAVLKILQSWNNYKNEITETFHFFKWHQAINKFVIRLNALYTRQLFSFFLFCLFVSVSLGSIFLFLFLLNYSSRRLTQHIYRATRSSLTRLGTCVPRKSL